MGHSAMPGAGAIHAIGGGPCLAAQRDPAHLDARRADDPAAMVRGRPATGPRAAPSETTDEAGPRPGRTASSCRVGACPRGTSTVRSQRSGPMSFAGSPGPMAFARSIPNGVTAPGTPLPEVAGQVRPGTGELRRSPDLCTRAVHVQNPNPPSRTCAENEGVKSEMAGGGRRGAYADLRRSFCLRARTRRARPVRPGAVAGTGDAAAAPGLRPPPPPAPRCGFSRPRSSPASRP
jgi:hypothetical protein